ncbi:necrosis inducing-like protein NPP1 type [Phytophthora sojae]|uniref:Necrosis inducing-like protein NPP1 type n=1 Tax=Phytophthora sojae (strain P6497) TaxID=1094619 RepID=G4YQN3_PHYSP|nr:necrosis inducing-like protein NPP1 type [Phytophthora sojae]EGZ30297.1 necrosis inducing-like protein NPP1 type [Phytophthora sojae]|eukprot:XP_009517572.1 necrosis inducing-like protein NPP1 type [Phytophthora sojae]
MKLRSLLFAAFAAGQLSFVAGAIIDHDKVQPFVQPEPVTVSKNAAVKFKPNVLVLWTCHLNPAVNAAGDTSGGLKGTGERDSACKAGWYQDMWAIMYAWYFPKDVYYRGTFSDKGFRHIWKNAVVWLDNPAVEKPKILAVSTSIGIKGGRYFNDSTPMLLSKADDGEDLSSLSQSNVGDGEFQDLIIWEQLTEEARDALSSTDFGETKVRRQLQR